MRRLVLTLAFLVSTSGTHAADPAPAPPAGRPDALGTSRVVTIGDQGPPDLGLKTYPETLALADRGGPNTLAFGNRCQHRGALAPLREPCPAQAPARRAVTSALKFGPHTEFASGPSQRIDLFRPLRVGR